MVRVPRISETRVKETGVSSVRVSADAPLSAFGGGRETETRATGAFISQFSDVVLQERKKAEDAMVLKGESQMSDFEFNLDNERIKKKGENAFTIQEDENSAREQNNQRIFDEAGNDRVVERLMKSSLRYKSSGQQNASKYVAGEIENFKNESFKAFISNETRSAANSLEENSIKISLAAIEEKIRERGLSEGMPENVIKDEIAISVGNMQVAVADSAKAALNSVIDSDPEGSLEQLKAGLFNDFLSKKEIETFKDEARQAFDDKIEEAAQDRMITFMGLNEGLTSNIEKGELSLPILYNAERNVIRNGGSESDINNIRTLRDSMLKRKPKSESEQSDNFEVLNQELDELDVFVRTKDGKRKVSKGSAELEQLLDIQNRAMRMNFTGEINNSQMKVLNKRLIPTTNKLAESETGKNLFGFRNKTGPYDSSYRIIQDHVESNNLQSFSKSEMLREMFRVIELEGIDKETNSVKRQKKIDELAREVIKIDFRRRNPSLSKLEDVPNAILKQDGTVDTVGNIDTKLKETGEIKGDVRSGTLPDGRRTRSFLDKNGKTVKVEVLDDKGKVVESRNF